MYTTLNLVTGEICKSENYRACYNYARHSMRENAYYWAVNTQVTVINKDGVPVAYAVFTAHATRFFSAANAPTISTAGAFKKGAPAYRVYYVDFANAERALTGCFLAPDSLLGSCIDVQAILHYEAMCMIKSNSTGFLYYKKTLREALKLAGGLARGNTLIPEVLEVYSKGICAGYLLSVATCDGRVYTKWFSNHDEAYALLQRIEQQEILVAELL